MPHQLVWWFMMPPIVLVKDSSPTADKITSTRVLHALGPVPPSSHRLASLPWRLLRCSRADSLDLWPEYFLLKGLCWKPKAQDEYLGVRSLKLVGQEPSQWDYPPIKKKIPVSLRGRRKALLGLGSGSASHGCWMLQMIFLYFFRWLYNFSCLFYKYRVILTEFLTLNQTCIITTR